MKNDDYFTSKKEKLDKIKKVLALARILTICGYGKIRFTCNDVRKDD